VAAVNGVALGGGSEIVVNADLVVAGRTAKFGFPEVKRGVYAGQGKVSLRKSRVERPFSQNSFFLSFLGGIPRLASLCGHIKASELLLTGKYVFESKNLARWGFSIEAFEDRLTDCVGCVVCACQDHLCRGSARSILFREPSSRYVENLVRSPLSFTFSDKIFAPQDDADVLPAALDLAQAICSASPDSVRATKASLEDFRRLGGVENSFLKSVGNDETRAIYSGENFKEGLDAFNEKRQPRWKDPVMLRKAKL
jgi:enoyl-CoA hydratase/carnithine racemase